MKGKLRIIHCFRSPVGGIFRHVRDLCEAQVAAGHDVGIVCDSTTGGDFEARLFETLEDSLALGVKRTPMQRHVGVGDLTAAWRTFLIVRQMRPDVLHGHGAKGGVYSRLFGTLMRAAGRRVARIYSPHGGSLHYDADTMTGRVFFLLEAIMDRFSDHLLFVSQYELDTFHRKVGGPRAPHSLVYNGLRHEEFEAVGSDPDAADFVYVGMMRDLKGPDIFIDALADAEARTNRQLTAAMIGDGEGLPRYQAQADARGLGRRVSFTAAMPVREALRRGRIAVVPSRAEAMPYIVLETLAAGKPMIASAVGGIPEIFGEHGAALAEPGPGALADRMAQALSDEEAFSRAMPPARELRARFGADVMAASIEEAYFAALGHASNPKARQTT